MSGVVIITGASRGIGASCARRAARDGYTVCVNYNRSQKAADALVADIQAHGGKALAVQADVSIEADIVRLFETADRDLGAPVGLINNAGITGSIGPITALTASDAEHVMRANLVSAMICSREAVNRMSTDRGGSGGTIVNITSAAAKLGGGGQYLPYAASKAGMETLTHGLGLELAGQGIRVVGIRPGLIDTDIHAAMGMPDRVADLGPTVPLGRAGHADEIAAAALWLMSPEASYITATTIEVTGGR